MTTDAKSSEAWPHELRMANGDVYFTSAEGAEEIERIILTMSIHPYQSAYTLDGELARIAPSHVVAITKRTPKNR